MARTAQALLDRAELARRFTEEAATRIDELAQVRRVSPGNTP